MLEYLNPEDGWRPFLNVASQPGVREAVKQSLGSTRQLSVVYVHGDLRYLQHIDAQVSLIALQWMLQPAG